VFSLIDSLSEIANPWFGLSPKFRVQIKLYAQIFSLSERLVQKLKLPIVVVIVLAEY